ncbi:MAG TPA: 3-methyl-2-oxobutanoate hydroxymethyltransferase [Planctomycetota bacterium]|nr:3-methyl-2-oxobutanoate hydroxymethyltransferase [Planctomycetota bacterium]
MAKRKTVSKDRAPQPKPAKTGSARHERKVTTLRLTEMKHAGDKIACLTAYDFLTARFIDQAGIDVILVGDSASMVFAGNDTTLPMKMDEMLYHVRVVTRAVKRALVVADMPFMSYHQGADQALVNAGRLMQDGHAEAVKLEASNHTYPIVERIVDAGIPVMGHVGLQPQSIHTYGTYKTRGVDAAEAEDILEAAKSFEAAGAFAVVIEKVPVALAERITSELKIPTIGIGAGPGCDGQILVTPDLLGLVTQFRPRFVRRYADLAGVLDKAFRSYRGDVKARTFPTASESY